MNNDAAGGYSVKKNTLIILLILLAGLAISWLIFSTEPTAQKEGATRKTAMLVDTTPITIGDHTPVIEVMGTVVPSRDIQLQARISGQIIEVSDHFVPGQLVQQGDWLLRLDPADFEIALAQAQSDLQAAQANLAIEAGEQLAAERDYQRLGRQLSEPQKSLVLRVPQLNAAKAQVAAAQAALEQAQLNLKRTEIKAPFNAQIQSLAVNLGSQISSGEALAQLVGTDTFWVEATLPVSQLAWLDGPSSDRPKTVTIQDQLAWPDQQSRMGSVLSVMGQVDDSTRMAQVLLSVDDPLGRENDNLPKMTVGSFVAVQMPIKTLNDVAKIERQHVRKNDTLWLMKDQKLAIKKLKILFRDAQHVYVQEGLSAGEQVVTTDISRVTEGAALRRASAAASE